MKRLTWEQDTEPYAVTRDNKIQKVARVRIRNAYNLNLFKNFKKHFQHCTPLSRFKIFFFINVLFLSLYFTIT